MKRRVSGPEVVRWIWPLVCFLLGLGYFLSTASSNAPAPIEVNPYQTALKEYNMLNLSALPQVTIWSSDFHISPIADLKFLLKDFNVRFIDKSLSGHCHLTDTCASDMKVITKSNGIRLSPCPNSLRRQFYDAYRADQEFMAVDAILCTHAMSMCELFMPFGKPLIMISSTRYEIGRQDRVDWERWNRNLELIVHKPHNSIAANNMYDAEYVKYFTSVADVPVLPSYCGYVATSYKPTSGRPFLLAPSRGVNNVLSAELTVALRAFNERQEKPLLIAHIRDAYPLHYEYSDLAAHPGIVLLPYQVSVMSLFEYYRMAIPLFVPSLDLLTTWHLQYRVLNERTWDSVDGHPERQSKLPKHANSSSSMQHDPNNEFDADALREWLALSDFYQWPHIHVFKSFEQLFVQLQQTNFLEVSKSMAVYNEEVKTKLKVRWKGILEKVYAHQAASKANLRARSMPEDVNEALEEQYGIRLSETDCTRQWDVT